MVQPRCHHFCRLPGQLKTRHPVLYLGDLFLGLNGLLDRISFDNKALGALALLTAASDPTQKDVLIRLVVNLLACEG